MTSFFSCGPRTMVAHRHEWQRGVPLPVVVPFTTLMRMSIHSYGSWVITHLLRS